MKKTGKLRKHMLCIISVCSLLTIITPAICIYAYGNDFNFNLRYGTDNDNDQCSAYRDKIFLGSEALVTVTSGSNASNNLKLKIFKKDYTNEYILGTASQEVTYTSSYLNKNLPIPYYPAYYEDTGMYALYGHCSTKSCLASGNWRP